VHKGLHHHRQKGPIDPPARLQQRREERPFPQLGDLELDIAALGRQQPRSAAVAVGGPAGSALVAAGADHLGGFGLDHGLEHQRQAFPNDIQVTASAQYIQQLRQGRPIEGHRGDLLGVNPGRNTLSLTRWPLGLLPNRQDPASNPTTTRDAYPHGNSFGLFCCSRADPICDRLPPIATQGLHKGYIACKQ
jgi:hypothetical protein